MNQTRLAVAVLLAFLMVAGWTSVAGGKAAEASQLSETLERIINEGSGGLICILL